MKKKLYIDFSKYMECINYEDDKITAKVESLGKPLPDKPLSIVDKMKDYVFAPNAFATITIPPDYIYNNIKYSDMIPEEQYEFLIQVITTFKNIKQVKEIIEGSFYIHYELHNNGNLHSHFVFRIYDKYVDYEIHLQTLKKIFIRLVKGNQHTCDFKFIKMGTLPSVIQYINKQNVYVPTLI